jgi:hypothetical protein
MNNLYRPLRTEDLLIMSKLIQRLSVKGLYSPEPLLHLSQCSRVIPIEVFQCFNLLFMSILCVHAEYLPVKLSLVNQTQTPQYLDCSHVPSLKLVATYLYYVYWIVISIQPSVVVPMSIILPCLWNHPIIKLRLFAIQS